jgi:hypothetical protein
VTTCAASTVSNRCTEPLQVMVAYSSSREGVGCVVREYGLDHVGASSSSRGGLQGHLAAAAAAASSSQGHLQCNGCVGAGSVVNHSEGKVRKSSARPLPYKPTPPPLLISPRSPPPPAELPSIEACQPPKLHTPGPSQHPTPPHSNHPRAPQTTFKHFQAPLAPLPVRASPPPPPPPPPHANTQHACALPFGWDA